MAQDKKERIIVTGETLLPELNVVNNILYIKNATAGTKVEIISILGNKVHQIEMTSSEGTYELNLPKAIYIFKLGGVVRKFIIR
ncbi:MAG: T9SS type A sorting domain-containing protein [Candidatus Symbiothrix sp.]|nr:T9SS type A sorting domain-containing protein [Candidatus Symbiothrix sp.]